MAKKGLKQRNSSGKYPCTICKEHHFLVEHHIHGRNIHNAEAPWNKVYICNNCHDKIHRGVIIVEDWIMTTSGKELSWRYENEEGLTGTDAKVHLINSHAKKQHKLV